MPDFGEGEVDVSVGGAAAGHEAVEEGHVPPD